MPDEQKTPRQEREERFDVSFKGPISALSGIAGGLGLGVGAEPESFFGGKEAVDQRMADGGPQEQEEESMFSEEDIAEFARRNPPPPGMKMPTATMKSTPAGQGPMNIKPMGIEPMSAVRQQVREPVTEPAPAAEPVTEAEPEKEEAKLITEAEAYVEARKPLPKIDTKEEWEKTQEKMPWWKKMLSDLKYFDPDDRAAGQKHREAEIEKKYQKHIQPQLMEREEAQRLLEVDTQYAQAEGDEWITFKFGGVDYPVQKKNAGQWSPQVLLAMQDQLDKTNTVNPHFFLGGDAPDVDLPGEEGRLYIDTYLKRVGQGLGLTDNDLARLQPDLHESIRAQKQKDALELITAESKARREASRPFQGRPDEARRSWMRDSKAMWTEDPLTGEMFWDISPEGQDYISEVHKSDTPPTNEEMKGYIDNLTILELTAIDPETTGIENDIYEWALLEKEKGFYYNGKRYPGKYEEVKKAITADVKADPDLDTTQRRKALVQVRHWLKKHYTDDYVPVVKPDKPKGRYGEDGRWISAEERPLAPVPAGEEDTRPGRPKGLAFEILEYLNPNWKRGHLGKAALWLGPEYGKNEPAFVDKEEKGIVVKYEDFLADVERDGSTEEKMRKDYENIGLTVGPKPGQ